MKKYWQCLLPPVAAGALCLIVFAIFQLFPFAQRTLSWCDMNQQVVPLLLDLKNVLLGQSDLFLNMANAGGTSFWGILLFFVSSPFSLLVAFIDTKDIYLFANILVFIKIVVCAGTASLFFRNKFTSLHVLQNIALSVMYAFCGYTMMYFQNVVWLDMMYMFPILLLGMDRMIQKEKALLYIIALTAMITINFYLCYMVAIFLILAIGLYTWFCVEKERRKKVICLFGISTLIVLCITGIVWVPSLLQYLQSGRGTGILESLSSGSFISEVYTTVPIITCTAIFIAIVPLYFICKKYKKRKLNIIGILFLLTLLPIFIEPINKMWHTGSYQAFPARYGYITVFLGLIIAADMLNDFNQKNTVEKMSVKRQSQCRNHSGCRSWIFINLQTMGYTYCVHQNLAWFLCSIGNIYFICVSCSHFLLFYFIAVLFKSYAQTDHVYFSLSYDHCGSDVLRQHLFWFCIKIHFFKRSGFRFAK